MIKKLILTGMLCLVAMPIFVNAQIKVDISQDNSDEISPIVQEKIENFAKQINTIIQREKSLMEEELKAAKGNADENGYSEEKWKEEKAKISEKHAERIDKEIENLGFSVDEIVQKQVRYSLLNSDESDNKNLKNTILKKYKAVNSISTYLSFGAMMLTNDQPNNDLDNNLEFSNNLEIGLAYNLQFSNTSPWGFVSGLGMSWRTLRLKNDKIFAIDNQNIILEDSGKSLSKSKLRTGYIMIPVGLQYNFSPLKTVGDNTQYRNYFDGFKIGAGFYGGVRMSSNNIVKGSGIKFRKREEYKVNPFIYGVQINFSYNDFALFIKKDFSNFFKDHTFENDKMIQIGITYYP